MDRAELIDLIEAYGKDIYSFCLSLTGNKADAEDLYQDSFLSLIRKQSSVAAVTNPKSYMLTVVVRRWKDKKRKYARRQQLVPMESLDELEEKNGNILTASVHGLDYGTGHQGNFGSAADYQPEKELLNLELQQEIRSIVSELDDKIKIPVYLYYMEELSVAEISRMLHLPQGTVKSRLHRARIIMKERMVELGYEI